MNSQSIEDLYDKSLNEIEKLFLSLDKTQKKEFSSSYLHKAKQKKDTLQIANGYYLNSLLYSHSNKAVVYADSIIQIAKNNSKEYLAKGYLQKGIQLYYLARYTEALDQYLIANKYFTKQQDKFHLLKVNHYIGLLKNAADQEREALPIFKKNILFFKNEYSKKRHQDQYFKSLFALADSYIRNNKIDSALIVNTIGIKESLIHKNNLYPYFLLSFGGARSLKKEYKGALDSLIKGSNLIQTKKKSLCDSYLIISDTYREIKNLETSINYLKKIDSIYKTNPQVIFQVRQANQKLYIHYKSIKNYKEQLKTVDKLLSIDSIMKKEYTNLDMQIVEKFDVPKLLSEKEILISDLKNKDDFNKKRLVFITSISFLLIIILFYFIRKKIIYKMRFNKLLSSTKNEGSKTTNNTTVITSTLELPKDIIEKIVLSLNNFEKSKKFITKKYTLNSLAKEFNTNSTYLSNIINSSKNTNFSNYLNNLKVEYAIEKLKTDKQFRSYTIKAIAEEVGFNTAQSFTNAFHKKTGIYPSYFIKSLKTNVGTS